MWCCIVLDITKGTDCRCSSGYNISKYPQDSVVVPAVSLDRLNTQVAEQTNSVLERIRTQVIFLLHMNCMCHLTCMYTCMCHLKRSDYLFMSKVVLLNLRAAMHVLVGGLHVARQCSSIHKVLSGKDQCQNNCCIGISKPIRAHHLSQIRSSVLVMHLCPWLQ